jgi:hypothetical protein
MFKVSLSFANRVAYQGYEDVNVESLLEAIEFPVSLGAETAVVEGFHLNDGPFVPLKRPIFVCMHSVPRFSEGAINFGGIIGP